MKDDNIQKPILLYMDNSLSYWKLKRIESRKDRRRTLNCFLAACSLCLIIFMALGFYLGESMIIYGPEGRMYVDLVKELKKEKPKARRQDKQQTQRRIQELPENDRTRVMPVRGGDLRDIYYFEEGDSTRNTPRNNANDIRDIEEVSARSNVKVEQPKLPTLLNDIKEVKDISAAGLNRTPNIFIISPSSQQIGGSIHSFLTSSYRNYRIFSQQARQERYSPNDIIMEIRNERIIIFRAGRDGTTLNEICNEDYIDYDHARELIMRYL